MSKFSKYTNKSEADYKKHEKEQVVNFMGGISYNVNPLLTLEMITASSIFGERSYYKTNDITGFDTTTEMFIEACDNALAYDFKGTLNLAKRLRKEYLMRLNPALIVIRAIMHKDRPSFNKENKCFMSNCISDIICIPTDIWNQFELWMFFNTTKNKLPSILKRIWANRLSKETRYHIYKYKTKAHITDLVRISHANSKNIDELMKTGTIQIEDKETTWETLRSNSKSWKEILQTTYVPHMALLRNLKNIFIENINSKTADTILTMLKNGVEGGKQFPFRYWSALQVVKNYNTDYIKHKSRIIDTLNICIEKSIGNFPKLKGKTICLSDNSGSAWGTIPSEYGSVTVASIGNLSSIITAINSDKGEVGVFGDKLAIVDINKHNNILNQLDRVNQYGSTIGTGTENGIWLFFDMVIKKKIYYDNIFIYSDMQAGHGGLYGLKSKEYENYACRGRYIDVLKLVQEYRRTVNPKVNVFSVQTAGYDNSVLPENEYRTSILTGWTGKEIIYANEMISIWNRMENNQTSELGSNNTITIKTNHY